MRVAVATLAVLGVLGGCNRAPPSAPAVPYTPEQRAAIAAELERAGREATARDEALRSAARAETRTPQAALGACPVALPELAALPPLEVISASHIAASTRLADTVSDDPDMPMVRGLFVQQMDAATSAYRDLSAPPYGRTAADVLARVRALHPADRAKSLVLVVREAVAPRPSTEDRFVGGVLRGVLYLFAGSATTPVCGAVVDATSGDMVRTHRGAHAVGLLIDLRTRAILENAARLHPLGP